MFYSPNQLGIYLTVGCLTSLYLFMESKSWWIKITLLLTILLIFTGIYLSESRGALVSLCAAVIYYAYQQKINLKIDFNWKIYLGLGLLLIATVYIVNSLNADKKESTSGRYFTILAVSDQISEKPLGHGLNSFSVLYNKAKAEYFENNNKWEEVKNGGYIYSTNNDILELTYELGIPWIIIFIIFILHLYWKKNKSREVLACRTLLICLVLFSLTNNTYTIPIFVLIGCFCSVFIISNTENKVIFQIKYHAAYKYFVMGFVLITVFIQVNRLNAEFKLYKLYQGKNYLKGINQLEGYLSKIDNKGEEHFMGGIILMKNGYKNQGVSLLYYGFELSGKPTLGKILADGLKKQKKFDKAETIYYYNKNVEPYRFEARMDLFNLYIETKQYKKANQMALEIFTLPVKIPSATIHNYKKIARSYLKKHL
jgi:hypothetical protein